MSNVPSTLKEGWDEFSGPFPEEDREALLASFLAGACIPLMHWQEYVGLVTQGEDTEAVARRLFALHAEMREAIRLHSL